MVETLFQALKSALVWRTRLKTRAEAAAAIGRSIPRLLHSPPALGFSSPRPFERQAAQARKRSLRTLSTFNLTGEMSGFAGLTLRKMQRTYRHHHPDSQPGVAQANTMRPARNVHRKMSAENGGGIDC